MVPSFRLTGAYVGGKLRHIGRIADVSGLMQWCKVGVFFEVVADGRATAQ